ncbi:tyrosine-type recombinase/integrase [Lacrimispora sphenoides]|uniref:tyrosine-type recombinase/integrase n=1 Tax=Lacrimispora sphenoides TaxID=29370 RepID=UPI000B866A52
MRRACVEANITQKSTHKIRKTFASKLDANGVPTDEIRILLGHTDTQMTLGYIYNPLPKNETLEMIRNAFLMLTRCSQVYSFC